MERILIVDDHPLVRDGMRTLLAASYPGAEVAEAASLGEAVEQLASHDNVDLVLLDVNIPDVTRLEGLRRLRRDFPIVPVVMVSGSFDRALVQEAVAAGASGFLPKSLKRGAIIAAVEQVMAGEIFLPDSLDEALCESPEQREILTRIDALTPQQRTVLHHLVRGQLNKQIAYDLGVSMTTVKAHVSAILQKLGVLSRTQAVIAANKVDFAARFVPADAARGAGAA